jgi:hypothetical protein
MRFPLFPGKINADPFPIIKLLFCFYIRPSENILHKPILIEGKLWMSFYIKEYAVIILKK